MVSGQGQRLEAGRAFLGCGLHSGCTHCAGGPVATRAAVLSSRVPYPVFGSSALDQAWRVRMTWSGHSGEPQGWWSVWSVWPGPEGMPAWNPLLCISLEAPTKPRPCPLNHHTLLAWGSLTPAWGRGSLCPRGLHARPGRPPILAKGTSTLSGPPAAPPHQGDRRVSSSSQAGRKEASAACCPRAPRQPLSGSQVLSRRGPGSQRFVPPGHPRPLGPPLLGSGSLASCLTSSRPAVRQGPWHGLEGGKAVPSHRGQRGPGPRLVTLSGWRRTLMGTARPAPGLCASVGRRQIQGRDGVRVLGALGCLTGWASALSAQGGPGRGCQRALFALPSAGLHEGTVPRLGSWGRGQQLVCTENWIPQIRVDTPSAGLGTGAGRRAPGGLAVWGGRREMSPCAQGRWQGRMRAGDRPGGQGRPTGCFQAAKGAEAGGGRSAGLWMEEELAFAPWGTGQPRGSRKGRDMIRLRCRLSDCGGEGVRGPRPCGQWVPGPLPLWAQEGVSRVHPSS